MPESTQVPTAPGTVYSVTCSGDCTVTTEVGGETITLATLSGGGQATFQAVSSSVVVSNPSAILLPFDGAPASLGRAGGVTEEAVAKAITAALYDEVPETRQTPAGVDNATCHFIELDAKHVPAGRLESISIRSRSGNNPATKSYLAVWELGADGETWAYLGSSVNAPGQTVNKMAAWEFEGDIKLAGRKVRLLAQEERSSAWVASYSIGLHTTGVPEGDGSKVYYRGVGYAFLPELAITVQTAVPKFAPASHVGDPTHLQEEGRVLRLMSSEGYPTLVMNCTEGYTSLTTTSMLITSPNLFRVDSRHPAFYRTREDGLVDELFFGFSDGDGSTEDIGIPYPGVYIGSKHNQIKLNGVSPLTFNGEIVQTATTS